MKWQTVVGEVISLPEIQQPFPLPVRVAVPMEELEARANRFVSLQAGGTVKPKPLKDSRRQRRWQERVLQEEEERLKDSLPAQFPVDDPKESSEPPNSPASSREQP